MKNEQFTEIIKCVQNINNRTVNTISKYNLSNLFSLPETDIKQYFTQVQKTQSEMDSMIVDFYHIIGMGNLSAPQISIFVKAVKEVLSHRNKLKTIIGYAETIQALAESRDLPEKGSYSIKMIKNKKIKL